MMKRFIALFLCLFTVFTTVQMSASALPTTTLTQAVSKPAQVTGVKATAGTNYVTLSWGKASGAQKYYVFRYDASKKKHTYIGKTTATSYKVSSLKQNTSYQFAVQSAKTVNGKEYYGKVSAPVSVKTKKASTVAAVSGLKITTSGKSGYLKLSWNEQKNITGFQVYRSTSGKSGTYERVAVLKSSQTSYADSGLRSAKPYYYAVRAYKKTSSGYVYSSYSLTNLSTKLTASFIKNQVEKANYLSAGWSGYALAAAEAFDSRDRIKAPTNGGYYVRIKSNKFKSKAEIKAAMATCFGGDVLKRLNGFIDDNYLDRNGKLYGREELGQGGDIEINRLYLKNVVIKNTSCTFTISGYCSDYTSYTESDTYTLYYRNGKWVYLYNPTFSNMDMYYQHHKWMN